MVFIRREEAAERGLQPQDLKKLAGRKLFTHLDGRPIDARIDQAWAALCSEHAGENLVGLSQMVELLPRKERALPALAGIAHHAVGISVGEQDQLLWPFH